MTSKPSFITTHRVLPHIPLQQLQPKSLLSWLYGLLPSWSSISRGQTNSTGPTATSELQTLCNMLQRTQSVTALTLLIQTPKDQKAGSKGTPVQGPAVAGVLREVGEAGGCSLQRLALLPLETEFYGFFDKPLADTWALSPEVVQVVGSHFPHLTHLTLHASNTSPGTTRAKWDAALACLPQTLQALSVALDYPEDAATFYSAVPAAALQLPQLHSLQVVDSPNVEGLAQAAPSARAPLRHLSLRRVDIVQSLTSALSTQLGGGLHSLTLEHTGLSGTSVAQLLGLLPGLRSLDLSTRSMIAEPSDMQGGSVILPAICSLQQLASLRLGLRELIYLVERFHGGFEKQHLSLPQSLRRLTLDASPYEFGWQGSKQYIALMLQHGWVPPLCHLVFEAGAALAEKNYAVAALQHPGGFSLRFRVMDAETGAKQGLEVQGMVPSSCPGSLMEAVSAQHQPLRALAAVTDASLLQLQVQREGLSPVTRDLEILALRLSPGQGSDIAAVGEMLSQGSLPSLKRLLLYWPNNAIAADIGGLAWNRGRAKEPLSDLVQAGIQVQVLPTNWCPGVKRAYKEMRAAMPDPDALLLGVQDDGSCWGV